MDKRIDDAIWALPQRTTTFISTKERNFCSSALMNLRILPLKQWQFLTSRNRCAIRRYTDEQTIKGKEVFPCMAGATNPGNIGARVGQGGSSQ